MDMFQPDNDNRETMFTRIFVDPVTGGVAPHVDHDFAIAGKDGEGHRVLQQDCHDNAVQQALKSLSPFLKRIHTPQGLLSMVFGWSGLIPKWPSFL